MLVSIVKETFFFVNLLCLLNESMAKLYLLSNLAIVCNMYLFSNLAIVGNCAGIIKPSQAPILMKYGLLNVR